MWYSGLYVEGMENGEEDVAALERRWLKPIYTAAPKLMLRYTCYASFGAMPLFLFSPYQMLVANHTDQPHRIIKSLQRQNCIDLPYPSSRHGSRKRFNLDLQVAAMALQRGALSGG